MVFGTAQLVTEEADKAAALAAFVHSVVPHRNRDVRVWSGLRGTSSALGQ